MKKLDTKNKKGFTLIELLVVITIIWILATWAVATYTSQIQKARDTTRINDMKAIETAVNQYYWDDSVFPNEVSSTTVWKYMPKVPTDAKDGQPWASSSWGTTTTLWYWYISWADSNWVTGQRYELSIGFENSWNVESKAANSSDSWNDEARLEVWIPSNTGQLELVSNSGWVIWN